MKNIIVIVATVALGIYIGATLLNGSTGSMKTSAESIVTNAISNINSVIAGD